MSLYPLRMTEKYTCYSCGELIPTGELLEYPFRTDAEMDAETLEERWIWENVDVSVQQVTKWTCGNCKYVSKTMRVNFETLVDLSLGNPEKAESIAEILEEQERRSGKKRKSSKLKPGDRLVNPNDALSAIVGAGEMLKTDVVKRFWGYVAIQKLRNPLNPRVILADDALKKAFGKERLDVFEVSDLIEDAIKHQ